MAGINAVSRLLSLRFVVFAGSLGSAFAETPWILWLVMHLTRKTWERATLECFCSPEDRGRRVEETRQFPEPGSGRAGNQLAGVVYVYRRYRSLGEGMETVYLYVSCLRALLGNISLFLTWLILVFFVHVISLPPGNRRREKTVRRVILTLNAYRDSSSLKEGPNNGYAPVAATRSPGNLESRVL